MTEKVTTFFILKGDKTPADCRDAQMYCVMQSMTRTSQQVRRGVLEYKGTGSAAKQFAREMTESGTVDAIRKLREKYNLHMKVERYVSEDGISDSDKKFIKE